MRKILLFIFIASAFLSCKSPEDKAMKLIDKHMRQNLFDYSNYKPFETHMKEAAIYLYADSVIRHYATRANAAQELLNQSSSESTDTLANPAEGNEAFANIADVSEAIANAEDSIKIRASELSGEDSGWEVTHRFRFRNNWGHSTITKYVYTMDKDLKKILSYYDIRDEQELAIRKRIDKVLNGQE